MMNLNDETKQKLRDAVFGVHCQTEVVKRLKDASRNNDMDRLAAVSIVYKVSNWYRSFGTTPPRGVRKVGVNILEDGVPLPNWQTFRSVGSWLAEPEYNYQLYFEAVEAILEYAVAQDSTVWISEEIILAEFGTAIRDFLRPLWERENASITYDRWWQQATGQDCM